MKYEVMRALPPVNPGEVHTSILFAADDSTSTAGAPSREIGEAMKSFLAAAADDPVVAGRVETAFITFTGEVTVNQGFRPVGSSVVPELKANGVTSFNKALVKGMDMIEKRKDLFRKEGISYTRPWLIACTDGYPTDGELHREVQAKMQEAIRDKHLTYLPIATGNADTALLQSYYPPETERKLVLRTDYRNFGALFAWLFRSISVVSSSDPDVVDAVVLPPLPPSITLEI